MQKHSPCVIFVSVSQVFGCLGDGAAQSRLHTFLLHLPLPGPPGSAGDAARVLRALPVRHLSGHPGPRSLWFTDLPVVGAVCVSVLADALERPVLEITR